MTYTHALHRLAARRTAIAEPVGRTRPDGAREIDPAQRGAIEAVQALDRLADAIEEARASAGARWGDPLPETLKAEVEGLA